MAHYIENGELYFATGKSPNIETLNLRLGLLFKLSDINIDLSEYVKQLAWDPVVGLNPRQYLKHLTMLLGKAMGGYIIPLGAGGSHWYRVANDLDIILVYQYAIECGYGSSANIAVKSAIQKRLSTHPNARLYPDHLIELLVPTCG